MKAVYSLALTVAAIGALAVAVSAQQPFPGPAPAGGQGVSVFAMAPNVWGLHVAAQNKANELAQQYVKAEKESERREIRQKLTEILNEVFDEHTKQQQKELDDLEKQLADLRAVIRKRSSAKATIVDRRIEQLIQDADGLGWNAPGNIGFDAPPFFRMRSTTAPVGPSATRVTPPTRKKTEGPSKSKDRKESGDE